MIEILGFAGSLRSGFFNRNLLEAGYERWAAIRAGARG